ncbi:MAG: hypothetical protein GWM98_20480 [Nitrospinaceae bacterium]|nr:hypothetical protein [Nitrospinaceae bacterium]NIR56411.1 hypothetical protein [Nitrospinaceae bacterium]NIS86875.1 hypothetical protein [Nitrospinaceae bacterium]NIT83711.1 hypothetical protein [Nitrospinaceae bacterium]NIU45912.1 hypothetical protein [Nitrospinaceae bacterium]
MKALNDRTHTQWRRPGTGWLMILLMAAMLCLGQGPKPAFAEKIACRGNCKNGRGIEKHYGSNGQLFTKREGEFKKGRLHGRGFEEIYVDGLLLRRNEGVFKKGFLEGQGTIKVYKKMDK